MSYLTILTNESSSEVKFITEDLDTEVPQSCFNIFEMLDVEKTEIYNSTIVMSNAFISLIEFKLGLRKLPITRSRDFYL